MYEKQKITAITKETKTSKKTGKSYESILLKTDKWGDKTLSGFGSMETRDWKDGDEVNLKVTETISTDGKRTFLNFEYPKKPSLEVRVNLLELWKEQVTRILKADKSKEEDAVRGYHHPTHEEEFGENPTKEVEYPKEEVNIDDIPF